MLIIRLRYCVIALLLSVCTQSTFAANKTRLSVLFPPLLPAQTLGKLLDASALIVSEIVVASNFDEFTGELALGQHDLIFAPPILAGQISSGALYDIHWQWQKKLKIAIAAQKNLNINSLNALQGLTIAMPPDNSRQSLLFEQLLAQKTM